MSRTSKKLFVARVAERSGATREALDTNNFLDKMEANKQRANLLQGRIFTAKKRNEPFHR
jgi:hypothetical protein